MCSNEAPGRDVVLHKIVRKYGLFRAGQIKFGLHTRSEHAGQAALAGDDEGVNTLCAAVYQSQVVSAFGDLV